MVSGLILGRRWMGAWWVGGWTGEWTGTTGF